MMPLAVGTWQFPPDRLFLPDKELHLWRFRLDLSEDSIEALRHALSEDEKRRADRLLLANKKKQFIVARCRLREILASYMDLSPEKLQFEYGPQGKPKLLLNDNIIRFNLAHSGCLALLGVIKSEEVGVDLEKIDRKLAFSRLAERFFTEDERFALAQASEVRKRRVFYRLWTTKESRLKERGSGFSSPNPSQPLPTFTRLFPLPQNYLGAISCSQWIDSIKKYHLRDTR
ncbi:4'-phosphopantetheinyl transferase superfamily protein [Malonomonas rubra]|uniref:4'-phosphopantetheinyl transferase family protein n=1 Tax=Malonomonas rubra TaxID=57040 RepID=UPI0026EF7AE6|nr:4'-phosphopantetheinyl transferase superfamily protein [Malonomonas rubra]